LKDQEESDDQSDSIDLSQLLSSNNPFNPSSFAKPVLEHPQIINNYTEKSMTLEPVSENKTLNI
jgi:hypothetical protein